MNVFDPLIAEFRAHPEKVAELLPKAVSLVELMPALLVMLIPPGPLRTYAEQHPQETLVYVVGLVDVLVSEPDLLIAALEQFG